MPGIGRMAINEKSESAAALLVTDMRDTWDRLASENAMHYIASGEEHWRERDFFASGESDLARHLDPVLARHGFEARGKSMLEIGCGVGRMSFHLARRFGEVDAVDISPEMFRRAREFQQKFGAANLRFHLGSGKDLAGFEAERFDLCFSYIVFQHVPDAELIFDYVREIGRVLKQGGMYLFQVNGHAHVRLSASTYLSWGIRDSGRLRKWGMTKRPFVRLGRPDLMAGVPIKPSAMLHTCRSAGLETAEIIGAGSQYMWFVGRKKAAESQG